MKLSLFAVIVRVSAAVSFVGATGCDRPPSSQGLAEWTPHDHDHVDEKEKVLSGGSSTGGPKKGAKGAKGAKGDPNADVAALVDLTWQQQCSVCHGAEGRGDGPNGPMVKAPDLTRPDFAPRTSDDDIGNTIRKGRGAMPPFDLPPEMVKGLVARIRSRSAGSPVGGGGGGGGGR